MQTISIQIPDSMIPLIGKPGDEASVEGFREKIQTLSQIFLWLSESEQDELIQSIERKVLLAQALRRTPSSYMKPFTIEEIVQEALAFRTSIAPKEKNWMAHAPIKKRQAGTMKGFLKYMADDFNAPMADFKDYM